MSPIFAVVDGQLIEMTEQPFGSEDELQRHVELHPELLAGELGADERRTWLLVKREMGIAESVDATARWSLDHLFVDEDGIPTLVEVKRSTDTRLRREVVGQMLDYAANAAAHWDAGTLRSAYEGRFSDPEAASQRLGDFLSDDVEPEAFWESVAANLADRRLRLVFLADVIPDELRSIIEFLNEQLVNTEVVGVEVKQHEAPDGQRSVVPRIIGNTETARRTKTRPSGPRRPRTSGSEERFFEETRAHYEPPIAERLIALYEHSRDKGTRRSFRVHTSAWMGERPDPDLDNPVQLTFWNQGGGLALNMKHFAYRRTDAEMRRLVHLFRQLPGTQQALDRAVAAEYRTFCTFRPDEVLATDEALENFKRALDEVTAPPASAVDSPAGP